MPIPNLLHPLNITIGAIDDAASASGKRFDAQAREPRRQVKRTTVNARADVGWNIGSLPDFLQAGVSEDVKGYLVFRFIDLDSLGYTPAIGDKITKIGRRSKELYLVNLKDAGHYPDTDGATLLYAFFTDRRPATSNPSFRR